MATIIRGSGGSGGKAASNALIANTDASKVLDTEDFVDANGDLTEGTMTSIEATTTYLGLGTTYTIPEGYHTGEGQIVVGGSNVMSCQRIIVNRNSTRFNNGSWPTTAYYRTSPTIQLNDTDLVIATIYIHTQSGAPAANLAGQIELSTAVNKSNTAKSGGSTPGSWISYSNTISTTYSEDLYASLVINPSGNVFGNRMNYSGWQSSAGGILPNRSLRFIFTEPPENEYTYELVVDLCIVHTQ